MKQLTFQQKYDAMGRKDLRYEGVFAIESSGLMVNWLVMVEGCKEKSGCLHSKEKVVGRVKNTPVNARRHMAKPVWEGI